MANENKYKEFPVDGNNKPIYSSTTRKIITIKGSALWQDLTVPDGYECKSLLAVAHRGNINDLQSLDEGLQYVYRTDANAGPDEWMPMASGSAPFAGKEGDVIGQVLVQTGIWLTVMFMA